MKNSYAPKNFYTLAAPLLCASLLASGCNASKPANFRDSAKETVADKDLREAAQKSDRVINVTVDAARNVFFRKEKMGTVENFGPLKEKVRQAVEKNRQADGDAKDSGSNVVFVCAPAEFKYGDVVGVIDAIRDAGGNPIGLQGCDPSAVTSSP